KFKITGIQKGGPYDLVVRSSTGSNQYFTDVPRTVTLTAGQKCDIGTIYIKLLTVAVKGTVYDSKVYDLANVANNLARAGVSNASVKAKYKRNDGTYYQVTSSPTLSGGSFEVQLPSLQFDFEISCSNYLTQSFPGTNINSYPNAYTGLDFKIKPQSITAYGKAYYDSNSNGYVDAADALIFTANGGAFQSLVNTLIVSYDYHSFTFDTFIQSDSTFVATDVPIGPDGTKRFTIYDRYLGNNIAPSPWKDSTGNNIVTLNTGGTNPSSIDIAVSLTESQYASFNGKVYDYKIWVEGNELYGLPTPRPGYDRTQTDNHVPYATIKVTSTSGFNQTFTSQADGRFLIKVPAGNTYSITYSATGYDDTVENNIVANAGTVQQLEGALYPKIGRVIGTIYYDNNINLVNSEPTDYNHIHEASEPTINSVTGHPTISSNWNGATFNVLYNYRGLTFGTTSFNRTNSQYIIERVPIGTYNSFVVQDVTSLSNWIGVGNDHSARMFMSQIYTLDGKTAASVTVAENTTTPNINFAVMVWGGHITGIKDLKKNETNFRILYAQPPDGIRSKMRGEDYWLALGGSLDQTEGLPIPRKYYLELFDIRDGGSSSGIKPLKFTDPQGVIKIFSYPVGNDPDIIIPPGTYVLAIAGDVDLSGSPLGPPMNTDQGLTWSNSPAGFPYRYGGIDRCWQNIVYYQGDPAATNPGIDLKAGQTHLIINED
ncbi:MAG TPA: carboxypeptidase-like regulatory domain-containing protein, partial [Candidatus Wallbacteria bacterium]|nr:carboxypeptidase-like regulatory domain-containing protein [Candidatus Wallbacteria bacterium]